MGGHSQEYLKEMLERERYHIQKRVLEIERGILQDIWSRLYATSTPAPDEWLDAHKYSLTFHLLSAYNAGWFDGVQN